MNVLEVLLNRRWILKLRDRELLANLQVAHGNYRNGMQQLESLNAYSEELDGDLDDICYDLGKIVRKVKELEEMLTSVREQLALTDYEQIRERLDHCIRRLASLPKEREECVGRLEKLRAAGENLLEKSRENERKKQELLVKKEKYGQIFQAEYDLGYVEQEYAEAESMEDEAGKLCVMFAGRFGK